MHRSMHRRTMVAALLTALALVVFAPVGAWAHTQVVTINPADGATLTAAPSQVQITFSEALFAKSANASVTGPNGALPVTVSVKGTLLTAALPTNLASGQYKVLWRVASNDGHVISGHSQFTLALPGTASSSAGSSAASSPAESAAPSESASTPAEPTPSAASTASVAAASEDSDPFLTLPFSITQVGLIALGLVIIGTVVVLRRRR